MAYGTVNTGYYASEAKNILMSDGSTLETAMQTLAEKQTETPSEAQAGMVKLYSNTGENTDGAMTQAAATTALADKASAYTYGTNDLIPGVSKLATGRLYFVYE